MSFILPKSHLGTEADFYFTKYTEISGGFVIASWIFFQLGNCFQDRELL